MAHPSSLLPVSTLCHVAATALVEQGRYGSVSRLAQQHGLSRQQVYHYRNCGTAALTATFTKGRQDDRGTVKWNKDDVDRIIVALRAATTSSIRGIQEALYIGMGIQVSYGTIVQILHDAEERAADWLKDVNLSAIQSVALDEMFSQGRPVFAGIDLDHGYLFLLKVHEDRAGDTWAADLGGLRSEQALNPERAVKDAGTGLAAGLRQAWPQTEEYDDLFHAVYYVGKVGRYLEDSAYRSIAAAEALHRERSSAMTTTQRRSLGQKLGRVEGAMNEAIDRFDRFDMLRRKLRRALEFAEWGSGRLRTPREMTEAVQSIAASMRELKTKKVTKVATYVQRRATGLSRYLSRLATQLKALHDDLGGSHVVEAAVRVYQAHLRLTRSDARWEQTRRHDELREAVKALVDATGRDQGHLKRVLEAVFPLLEHRHRASSAIENLNSVLRPYLVAHKHAGQGFLNLFQFHWNTRKRQWGRGKGTSAYESLTGTSLEDPLSLLGFPPSDPQRPVIQRRALAACA